MAGPSSCFPSSLELLQKQGDSQLPPAPPCRGRIKLTACQMFPGSSPWPGAGSLQSVGREVEEGVGPRPSRAPTPRRAGPSGFLPCLPPTPTPAFDLVPAAASDTGLLCCVTPAGLLTSLASHFTFWEVGRNNRAERVFDFQYHRSPLGL